jgi:hypothetical protein
MAVVEGNDSTAAVSVTGGSGALPLGDEGTAAARGRVVGMTNGAALPPLPMETMATVVVVVVVEDADIWLKEHTTQFKHTRTRCMCAHYMV